MNLKNKKKIIYPLISFYIVFTSYFAGLFIINKFLINDGLANISQNIIKRGHGVLITDQNSNKILIDTHDTGLSPYFLRGGEWEPHISKLFQKIIKPGQTIISLGAHIGFHVIEQSKLVGNNGHIHCFEPNPTTLPFLRANVAFNNAKNTTIYDKAAYDKNTNLSFAAKNSTACSHVLTAKNRIEDAKHVVVKAVKLDNVLSHVNKVDIIQMDIEGSEPNAIYGATNLIKRSPNVIVIQEWSIKMMSEHSNVIKYINFWRNLGYKFAKISDSGLNELSNEQLLQISHCDLLISKNINKINAMYQSNPKQLSKSAV